ncbi:UDP-Glycosyltransferase/glycogen phosphorylase [Rhizophagus irregularis]|uniref:UDP-Glycosyltransferase/glycogen phosphorylase n=1 Tax=Rhizophagus irregularis TaxID=588596 RepID=A0A2I1G0W7_9GLOM|nr:UDP-Glycosyltransferase/glycogen phosphorylase [Rhizophagus irregularis]
MIKKNFIVLLSILILFLNQIYATYDYVPRSADIDRSPKNILVGSFIGGRSHLKPMLDITTILSERGYNVILLTKGNYTPSSEYPTVKQISLGPALNYKELMKSHIHKDVDFNGMMKFVKLSLESYRENYEKYINIAKDNNIDLFFCDTLVNDVCLDAAHTLKKPVIGFSSSIYFTAPVSYKSDPLYGCNISLENEPFLKRFKCIAMHPFQVYFAAHSFIDQLNDIRKKINVEPGLIALGNSPRIPFYLVDGFFGFVLPQSLPSNVQEIGPVLSDDYPPLTPELSNFMNTHKRVLYVAFGTHFFTTTENNNKLLQSFIEAINKNIIDGVVWALVETSKDSYSSTLNLTDGTQVQTSPILNNEHPHIHIAAFAPQFSILNHTNTKLFFSHGGAGSSHESLYTGTPMLILPFGSDQMGNADKLKSAGVALTLYKFTLDVNDIINKIDFLLRDENVKKNSKRIEILSKINSKRKYRAADLIEYILHSSSIYEGIDKEFLKEWIPAESRMGFIKKYNYDVYGALLSIILGFIGGILWVTFKLIGFIIASSNQKQKYE